MRVEQMTFSPQKLSRSFIANVWLPVGPTYRFAGRVLGSLEHKVLGEVKVNALKEGMALLGANQSFLDYLYH
jgi:hypothetical protein